MVLVYYYVIFSHFTACNEWCYFITRSFGHAVRYEHIVNSAAAIDNWPFENYNITAPAKGTDKRRFNKSGGEKKTVRQAWSFLRILHNSMKSARERKFSARRPTQKPITLHFFTTNQLDKPAENCYHIGSALQQARKTISYIRKVFCGIMYTKRFFREPSMLLSANANVAQ